MNGDGLVDVLSGSWPGEVYLFEQRPDGGFAAPRALAGADGREINVGSAASAQAVDWDADGDLDLLVGVITGDVFLLVHDAASDPPGFAAPMKLEAGGQPLDIPEAAPVAADWDGDGRLDLIVGGEDGSVVWHRNEGTPHAPQLAAGQMLVGPSPIGWRGDRDWLPGQWGLRVKPCVADYNGDGRLDLLLGDRCGGFEQPPSQGVDEAAEADAANNALPELMARWQAAFRDYRRASRAVDGETDESRALREAEAESALAAVLRYKEEIAAAQRIQDRYRPQQQSHGYVWLFLRLGETATATPPSQVTTGE